MLHRSYINTTPNREKSNKDIHMQLDPEKQKKIKRLATAIEQNNPAVSKHIFELEDKLDSIEQRVEELSGFSLSEQDKQDIAGYIEVPVVEKVVEKTERVIERPAEIVREIETIKEVPVVKEVIKEVSVPDDAVIGYLENKIEELDKKIVETSARKGGGGIHKGAVQDLITEAISSSSSWIAYCGGIYTGTTATITDGEVLTYIYNGDTVYRHITTATDAYGYPEEDAFYTTFNNPTLSGLIVARG